MASQAFERAVLRRRTEIASSLGVDARRLREDAGLSRRELARGIGIDASYLGDIESGAANPSIEICARLSLGLGADLPLRLYPTTGPTIRDRLQAPVAEATLRILHRRWQPFLEVGVRRPSRGWIDIGLHDPFACVFVATEIQSELLRLEQLLRWSESKASALPSWDGWAHLGAEPSISRLLIVRETRTNRLTAAEHRRLLRASYPARGDDALEALTGDAAWPGPAVLWAARDRGGNRRYRLVSRP